MSMLRKMMTRSGPTDVDAIAFIESAALTDSTHILAINTLVIALKNANLWEKMKAIYPFVGGTAFSHKFNLKDPRDLDIAYRLVFIGGFTHSNNGILPNGTNAYANPFIIPSVDMTTQSGHFSYYSRTNPNLVPSYEWGAVDASGRQNGLILKYSSGYFYSLFGAFNTAFVADSLGFGVANIFGVNTTGYKNGTKIIDVVENAYLCTKQVYLFCINSNDSSTLNYTKKECAFASAGLGLTDAEALIFYNIVQEYQITLNRQV